MSKKQSDALMEEVEPLVRLWPATGDLADDETTNVDLKWVDTHDNHFQFEGKYPDGRVVELRIWKKDIAKLVAGLYQEEWEV